MKALHKTLIALAAGTLMTAGAQAAVNYNTGYVAQPYVGAKVGKFNVDINAANTTNDDPMAYGIYGGYNFDPNFGVEAEYVGSDKADLIYKGLKGEYDAKSYGVYGTYRYGIPNTGIYAKGRLGIAKTEVDGSVKGIATDYKYSNDETSLAGGVGLGFQPAANFAVEANYDRLGGDVDMMSIGAHVKF